MSPEDDQKQPAAVMANCSLPPCSASLYQIIGAFDSYGACRWLKIYRERDGSLSQNYPGHSAEFVGSSHKRWRWWIDKGSLDGPELMHWIPDAEEMDKIERIVASERRWNPDIPRFSLEGQYPNWKQVYDPRGPNTQAVGSRDTEPTKPN